MFYRKFLSLLLFTLFSLKGFSATFIVTSNADSGPGTLRDALTQAGTAETANPTQINSITFNIADVNTAGRTITILSQLPDISSNLTIDGSTQPGTKFGVSDAKVAVFYNPSVNQNFSGLFVNNANNVAIYGLYLKNIADVSKANLNYYWKGIDIEGGSNIQLGAASKGNVIIGFEQGINSNTAIDQNNDVYEFTTGLIIKDDIVGVDADGKTVASSPGGGVALGNLIGNINIGGTAAEGNTFALGLNIGQENSGSPLATIIISNNNIGVDYQAENAIPNAYGVNVGNVDPNGDDIVTIEDNVIATQSDIAIDVGNINQQITIIRNYIGTNKTLQKTFPMLHFGIFISADDPPVKIGDDNPADANYITNCKPVTIYPFADVMVNKNSFFCTIDEYPMHDIGDFGESAFPVVAILNSTATNVSGTATPNSSIELFYSDKCGTCSPQTYFASATADNNGKWAYNGPITGTVIASATIGGNTSEFTRTDIDSSQVKVINACTANGLGSIVGMVPESAATIQWVDQSGKVVGTAADLTNVPPGIYKLTVQNGSCSASSAYYEIKATFVIDDSGLIKTNPSCGIANGSITGVIVIGNETGTIKFEWKDANNKLWSYTPTLTQAPAGAYTLYIANEVNACTTTYGPITLNNTTGPNIDQTNQHIQSTNCGQSTGSIRYIVATGSGTLKYTWLNSNQQTVGTDSILLNQPAGVYQLEVSDDSQCGPVYSTNITIPQTNGITIDESGAITTPATCGMSNGSVTGILLTGATSYIWTDATGKTYNTSAPDITKAYAGTYTLTATNTYGCSVTSKPYIITQPAPTQFSGYVVGQVEPCYGNNNGALSVIVDNKVKSERWLNMQTNQSYTGTSVSNLAAGSYSLYLTDQNGCEDNYITITLTTLPQLMILDRGDVVNSECGLTDGNINGLLVTGGVPPYTYQWTDASGNIVGTNSNSIYGLASGTYGLTVSDVQCGSVNTTYSLLDNTIDIATPSVSNIALCSSGNLVIKVNNPDPTAVYRLYNSATAATPVDEQTGGQFTVSITNNSIYYISEVNGSCESSRAEVKITVGLSAINIANTFTPNGDGINDYWQINNIQNYPAALVQIFNRYGQKLFESRGYAKPFDGKYNGKPLPSGVYYYIINLSSNCNLLSGSITIVR